MKSLAKLFTIAALLVISVTSCKKATTTPTSNTVKYVITWPAGLVQSSYDQVIYTNTSGNAQTDTNISGTGWTETITYPPTVLAVSIIANVATAPGTCDVKIYVNGVLKSENSGTGINESSAAGTVSESLYTVQATASL